MWNKNSMEKLIQAALAAAMLPSLSACLAPQSAAGPAPTPSPTPTPSSVPSPEPSPVPPPPGGLPDESFGSVGRVLHDIGASYSEQVNDLAIQPDGKIVAVGTSSYLFAVARYLPNGSIDASFGTNGKTVHGMGSSCNYDEAYAVALQPDGKIVAVGRAYDCTVYEYRYGVVRYTTAGALDPTFGTGGKVITQVGNGYSYPRAVAIQPDGKILVGGELDESSGSSFAVLRYNPDGTLDTAFGTSGIAKVTFQLYQYGMHVSGLAVLSDGKIVAGGTDGRELALARLNSNGTLDTAFGAGGTTTLEVTQSSSWNAISNAMLAVQADGRILIGGTSMNDWSTNSDIVVARVNASGAVDQSWGESGILRLNVSGGDDYGMDFALQADGRLVVAGYSDTGSSYDLILVRLDSNGGLDASFGENRDGKSGASLGSGNDLGRAIAIQADGKIVVGGSSDQGTPLMTDQDFALARFTK